MTTDLENQQAAKLFSAKDLVYVRRIAEQELEGLPPEALDSVNDRDALFVLANGEGQQLAIVEGRDAAFAVVEDPALVQEVLEDQPDCRAGADGQGEGPAARAEAQHRALRGKVGQRRQRREGGVTQDKAGACHSRLPAVKKPRMTRNRTWLTRSRAAKTTGSSCIWPRWVMKTIRLIQ